MSKKKRLMYRGESRDATTSPWLRLVHGRHYDVEKHVTHSGKVRARISDGYECARIDYKSQHAFDKEWC